MRASSFTCFSRYFACMALKGSISARRSESHTRYIRTYAVHTIHTILWHNGWARAPGRGELLTYTQDGLALPCVLAIEMLALTICSGSSPGLVQDTLDTGIRVESGCLLSSALKSVITSPGRQFYLLIQHPYLLSALCFPCAPGQPCATK